MPSLDRALLAAMAAVALACARNPSPATPPTVTPEPAPNGTADSAVAPMSRAAVAQANRLPDVPSVRGPLALHVMYPAAGAVVEARDSSFLFGSTGSGDATLTINGRPVRVWPNGAWLAWVELPRDSVMQFRLEARTPRDTARLLHVARRPPAFTAPPGRAAWIDSTSLSPRGRAWLRPDEYLPLTVRAAEGATVRLRLADGTVVPFVQRPARDAIPWGIRAFDRDTAKLRMPLRTDRYVGLLRGRRVGSPPGPIVPPIAPMIAASSAPTPERPDSLGPVLEVIIGTDTARTRWPLGVALLDSMPVVVELDDDAAVTGLTDSVTIGRAAPGGTYHWFWPTGTRAAVTGRVNDALRIRLSATSEAWIPVAEARPLVPGRPVPRVTVGAVSLTPESDHLSLRIPLGERVPFRVDEDDRGLTVRIYGAVGDIDWMQYGGTDSLVELLTWAQPSSDEVTVRVDLAQPVWGWRTRWSGDDLVVDIRRPPAIDRGEPLRGLRIAVDPGHPPLGATGPTGLREADANLAVSLILAELLRDDGAEVLMTRIRDTAIELLPRIRFAEQSDADLLVSVHNNALPDGVNPLVNSGTSVYYNHPRSAPLARAVQQELVRRLGVRDLGFGRGDLALVRPTWMPAILTEGLFLMVPDQESALRSPEGQRLYAEAVHEGIRRFLRDRAEAR